MRIRKYDIFLVDLEPTFGSQQRGVRPCLVVQNNRANDLIQTIVVCPMTSTLRRYPHFLRVAPSSYNGLKNESSIDILQIKAVDKKRLIRKIGFLDAEYMDEFSEKFSISFDLEHLF